MLWQLPSLVLMPCSAHQPHLPAGAGAGSASEELCAAHSGSLSGAPWQEDRQHRTQHRAVQTALSLVATIALAQCALQLVIYAPLGSR